MTHTSIPFPSLSVSLSVSKQAQRDRRTSGEALVIANVLLCIRQGRNQTVSGAGPRKTPLTTPASHPLFLSPLSARDVLIQKVLKRSDDMTANDDLFWTEFLTCHLIAYFCCCLCGSLYSLSTVHLERGSLQRHPVEVAPTLLRPQGHGRTHVLHQQPSRKSGPAINNRKKNNKLMTLIHILFDTFFGGRLTMRRSSAANWFNDTRQAV